MARWRVGLVGCGGRQPSHVAAFRAVPSCELVAVADRLDEVRQPFLEKHGIAAGYASVSEMVAAARPDVVAIATRAIWMREPVLEAIAAGVKGILLEKPFGADLEEAAELLAAARAAGVALLINHQYRYFPHAERMREIVAGGELGELEFCRAVSSIKLHGQGTHMIDFVRYVRDDRPFAWALGTFAGGGSFDAKQPGPDMNVGLLSFDDGVPLYIETGPDASRSPYPEERLNLYADVVGTRGRVWFGLSRGLRIWGPDGRYEEMPAQWPQISEPAQVKLVEELLAAVEHGTPSRCDATVAYATQEALCALLESGLSHRKVSMPAVIEPGLMARLRAAVS